MPPSISVPSLNASQVRYIKLGPGKAWAKHCLENNELHFGNPTEPHDLCLQGDWEGAGRYLIETLGQPQGVASGNLRELREFYTLGEDCLWVTFAQGYLWWAFAEPEVFDLRGSTNEHGCVMRKVLGWRNTNLQGFPLPIDRLSSHLTMVAAYRKTICTLKAADYLLGKINSLDEPSVARAHAALVETVAAAQDLLERLRWSDFEVLVDLIFQRSGWQRVSMLGGTMPDADLIVEQPATGERALVQVKSRADQAVLRHYEEVFRSGGYDRMFFVCHSPQGQLTQGDDRTIHVWSGPSLARRAVDAGLLSWLMERCG
jgi:hypothetical protein